MSVMNVRNPAQSGTVRAAASRPARRSGLSRVGGLWRQAPDLAQGLEPQSYPLRSLACLPRRPGEREPANAPAAHGGTP
eukprot:6055448-Prymnesium_polylepis.2